MGFFGALGLTAKLANDAERRERSAKPRVVADPALQRDRLFAGCQRFVETSKRREQHHVAAQHFAVQHVRYGVGGTFS